MIHFEQIDIKTFLKDYWQKKPLLIRNALPNFINPLSPDELAGLALEEDIESRIVYETPGQKTQWHLQRGPFTEKDFNTLPKTHWTLLVQGVDRVVPEVHQLLDHFDFLPQWRIDDIMISYAVDQGSVGPHYDNYDVFLFQALGQREWRLSAQKCTPDNYIQNLELRIMNEFNIEEQFVLEEGDMLYLPPHIGHYGIAVSPECMTYSFGYRSYPGQEILDSLSDYSSEKGLFNTLYQDPDWSSLSNSAEIPPSAWQQAQKMLREFIDNEQAMKSWFACFATRVDQQAEQQLAMPLNKKISVERFLERLQKSTSITRDPCCRFAYHVHGASGASCFFANGEEWDVTGVTKELIKLIANTRTIPIDELLAYLKHHDNQAFLFKLWMLQWLQVS